MNSQITSMKSPIISQNNHFSSQQKFPCQQQFPQGQQFGSSSQQFAQISSAIPQTQAGDQTECFKKISACLTRESEQWKYKYEILEKQSKEELNKLKEMLLNESKLIIERELTYQAQQFELDKAYLEQALSEAETKLTSFDISQNSQAQLYQECLNALKQKEKYIEELLEDNQVKEASNQQYIDELKQHYEQVLSSTEERIKQLVEAQYQTQIQKLLDEIESQKQQIANYDLKFDSQNQEIINLKQQLIEKTNHAQEWEQKYYQLEKKIFGQTQLTSSTNLQTKYTNTAKELDTAKKLNQRLKEDIEEQQKEVEKMAVKMDKKKKKLSKLECDYKKLQLQKQKEIEIEVIKEIPVIQEIIKEVQVPIEIIREIEVEKPVQVYSQPQVVVDNSQQCQLQQQIQCLQSCHCQVIHQIILIDIKLECEVQSYKQAYEEQINCCEELAQERDEYRNQCEKQCRELKCVKELFISQENERDYLISQINNYQQCLKDFDTKISCKNAQLMKNIDQLDQEIGQSRMQFSSVCRPDHSKIASIEEKVSKRMQRKNKI